MDYSQIVEILYSEFGHDKFLTRHIPAEAMNRLSQCDGNSRYRPKSQNQGGASPQQYGRPQVRSPLRQKSCHGRRTAGQQ